MPGFAINNGTSNGAAYDGQTMGINGNGGGGNQSPLNNAFTYNGLPEAIRSTSLQTVLTFPILAAIAPLQ